MADVVPTTPLMEQYEGIRARYPGHLGLVRVGDFYETFGEDAKLVARELEITLTARSPDSRGDRVPMAGVPHHAVEGYLARLLRKGYRVAICDQVEDARLAKGLVRREVTRVVTPGTVVEDRILAGPDHNFLAVLDPTEDPGAYALVDLTTGEWFHDLSDGPGPGALVGSVAALGVREILVADGPGRSAVEALLRTEFPGVRVDAAPAPLEITELPERLAEAVAAAPPSVGIADRRLAAYVRTTQPRLLALVVPRPRVPGGRRLRLDAKTLRHLEIVRPMNPDDPSGATLLSSWDVARSPSGRRTFSYWLRNPLADVDAIRARHDAVEWLSERGADLLPIRRGLATIGDLGRIGSRLAGRRVRPPELAALRDGLAAALSAARSLADGAPPLLAALRTELEPPIGMLERLRAALPDQPPATAEGPGLFRAGVAPEVDAPLAEERDALAALEALERTEQAGTGIRTLRIGYNQVFGYYIEVSRPNLAKVPAHYRRKQTISGGERYVTDTLGELETRIQVAREAAGRAEAQAWERFLTELDAHVPSIHRISRAIGELDVLAGFAEAAQSWGLVKPEMDASGGLRLRDARHPILDRAMAGRFVPNDIDLDADGIRMIVLTGPNMSGKSTYMRTLGLCVVLAQAGAFVPARFARIGVVDAIHTRMGFTDEIGRGKSSFLVEMSEVAEILRDAGPRSLVLLDEVGRGTSTFDGLALAWAILRYLHDRSGCRTILATHYHQLTELVEGLPGARNAHLAVREKGDEIVFLHRLVPGSTDRSYGLHVARVAGLPPEALDEARRTLQKLEAAGIPRTGREGPARASTRYTQAVLLGPEPASPSELEVDLRAIDPDTLTPMQALHWLSEHRKRLDADVKPGEPT
ncbi:MAG: DNA mismatch repair protein MutS [Thermoplasmata archaeon]|nr:DNA mismatch repair protein MutS [Thermoplasmata archaeon]